MTEHRGLRLRLADFTHLLSLTERHQRVAQYFLLGKTAAEIAAELKMTQRAVYEHWDRIKAKHDITGVAGLANLVSTAVFGRLAAETERAGAPRMACVLEDIRTEQGGIRRKRKQLSEFTLADFTHELGLTAGREREAVRCLLCEMTAKEGARAIGIRRRTFNTYLERAVRGLRPRRTVRLDTLSRCRAVCAANAAFGALIDRIRQRYDGALDVISLLDELSQEA